MIYTRDDSTDAKWCSARYMAAKTGLPVVDCATFLSGPEHSKASGLDLTKVQAIRFNNTLLTAEAEAEENNR